MKTRSSWAGCIASAVLLPVVLAAPASGAARAAAPALARSAALGQTIAAEIDRDKAELKQYRLTMPKIRQWAAATLAIAKEAESDPALAKRLDDADDPDPKTLSELAARIDKEPRLAAAVKNSGLTAREYSMLTLCYIPAMAAFSLQKQGVKDVPGGVLPENVALIAANEAEIDKINKDLEAHGSGR